MRTLPLYFSNLSRSDSLFRATNRMFEAVARAPKVIEQILRQTTFNQRLAAVAAIILFSNIWIAGNWVTRQIEQTAVESAARQLALQVEPKLQSLASNFLNDLDVLAISPIGVTSARLWKLDGTGTLVSGTFVGSHSLPAVEALKAAAQGQVSAVYADQSLTRVDTAKPEFQIFVPVRANGSNGVLAIAEFDQNAVTLQRLLAETRWNASLMAALLSLALMSLPFAMMRATRRAADEHNRALNQSIEDKKAVMFQAATLRQELHAARRRAIELNERFLRRLSSDLHDGPAQHLALALLRLEELSPRPHGLQNSNSDDGVAPVSSERSAVSTIQRAITDALREIRNISSGLALPELQKISPADALGIAARAHERATGTAVAMRVSTLPPRLPLPLTICLFRFAQEGLNNAFRHAGGKGQQVSAACNGASIEVEVIDQGPGFEVDQHLYLNERIGLTGLRHRVEALGGFLQISSFPGSGTRISVRFPYQDGGIHG